MDSPQQGEEPTEPVQEPVQFDSELDKFLATYVKKFEETLEAEEKATTERNDIKTGVDKSNEMLGELGEQMGEVLDVLKAGTSKQMRDSNRKLNKEKALLKLKNDRLREQLRDKKTKERTKPKPRPTRTRSTERTSNTDSSKSKANTSKSEPTTIGESTGAGETDALTDSDADSPRMFITSGTGNIPNTPNPVAKIRNISNKNKKPSYKEGSGKGRTTKSITDAGKRKGAEARKKGRLARAGKGLRARK